MKTYKGLELDRFQQEAIEAINENQSVIVAAPTGSGKTLIAEYAIEKCLAEERKIIYTSPIKALSNQKFRDFSAIYGSRIGIMTGDVTINPEAQVLIMTTEVFRNTIFEDAERLENIDYCIFDEIHFMDDRERGTVWEESIIFAPQHIRFLCLSATISNLQEFANWISEIRDCRLKIVLEKNRVVPLEHHLLIDGKDLLTKEEFLSQKKKYIQKRKQSRKNSRSRGKKKKGKRLTKKEQNIAMISHLRERDHMPCIFFLFSRAACEALANSTSAHNYLNKEEKARMEQFISEAIRGLAMGEEEMAHANQMIQYLRQGVGYHHAGLLPGIKELVERCFSTGLVKVLFATETFALGVNMPARSVAFESLRKFNGIREVYIKSREYQQMAGRAGRRGIDPVGYIYSGMFSERDVPKQVVRVITGEAEKVSSRFNMDYCTLLNLYKRLGDNLLWAWEKSFANYKTQDRKRKPNWYNHMLSQVNAKLRVLKQTGYIEKDHITEKGELALKISGYEIQLTEMYAKGILAQLNPIQLNILFSAIVFEGRSDGQQHKFSLSNKIRKRARYAIHTFSQIEKSEKISSPIKELDFAMAFVTQCWSEEKPLSYIAQQVGFSAGDIVRNLRRTVQVLRTFEKALSREKRADIFLLENLQEAIALLKRDMVDAESQLKRGLEEPDETAIAAALRKAGLLQD